MKFNDIELDIQIHKGKIKLNKECAMSENKLFKNSLFFSIGIVLGKAASFLLLPIYTHYLSDAEYGIATTLVNFSSVLGLIIMLSLRAAMIRFYNEYKDEEERKIFIGSLITLVMISFTVIVFILTAFRDLYAPFVFKGINFFPLVFAALIAAGFEGLFSLYQSIWQADQNGKAYSINNALYLISHVVINSVLVVFAKMGAGAIVWGAAINAALFSIYGIVKLLLKNKIRICLNLPMIRRSVLYSLPILPHNLSNNISTLMSKLILNHNISYSASGRYTVASQISTIMSFVQASLNLAFRPWFIEQMDRGEIGRKEIKNASVLICTIYCFVSVGIALFSQEIIYLFTSSQYRSSWRLVPILVSALTVAFIYYSHIQTIMYNVKASKFAFVCSITGCMSNILLSLILVDPLDSYGVALAYLLSQIILATITVVVSRRTEKVDFGLSKMVLSIFISSAIMVIFLFPSYMAETEKITLLNILYKFAGLIIAFFALFWGRYQELLSTIKGVFSRKKSNLNKT